jgi:hypothetical protein
MPYSFVRLSLIASLSHGCGHDQGFGTETRHFLNDLHFMIALRARNRFVDDLQLRL